MIAKIFVKILLHVTVLFRSIYEEFREILDTRAISIMWNVKVVKYTDIYFMNSEFLVMIQ